MADAKRKDIVVRFLTDTTSLNKGLKEAEGLLTSFSKKVNTSSGDLAGMNSKVEKSPHLLGMFKKGLNDAGNEIVNMTRGIPVIGRLIEFISNMSPQAKIAAVAIGFITASVVGMIQAGSQAETQLTAMAVLLKKQGQTMDQTKDFYQEMINLAGETPLASNQVTEAAKRLLAVEVPMGKVKDMIRTIGDVSAGSGKNFLELVDIMAKNKTSGIIQGEDINQLAGAGIPILAEFSRMTGKTAVEIKKMGADGKLTYDMLVQAMQNMSGAGGMYESMMKKQSMTIAGLWSTIRDDVGMTMLFMSGAMAKEGNLTFMSRIKDIMFDISSFTGSFFRENQGRFQTLGLIIGNLLTIFWQFAKTAHEIFKPVLSIIGAILGFAIDIGLTLAKWAGSGIIEFLKGVAWVFTSIYDIAANIGRWFYNFSGMASGVTWFINKIDDFIASIKLGIFFTNAYIKSIFVSWSEAIDNFLNKHSLIKGVIGVLTGQNTGVDNRTDEQKKEDKIKENNARANEAYERAMAEQKREAEREASQQQNKETLARAVNQFQSKITNTYNNTTVQQTQFFNTDKKERENNFYNLSGQPGY